MEDGPSDDDTGWYDARIATLGDRIVGAREAAGLSQSALARGLGVRLGTVQGWEEDRAEPRANKLQMAAGVLNVSVGWLLTGEGDGPDGPPADRAPGQELRATLAELRRLRAEVGAIATRLGHTEARLAQLIREAD
ncbi:MAG: helix-turn-helix domain-containing protein [Alkalilacustris sp.]